MSFKRSPREAIDKFCFRNVKYIIVSWFQIKEKLVEAMKQIKLGNVRMQTITTSRLNFEYSTYFQALEFSFVLMVYRREWRVPFQVECPSFSDILFAIPTWVFLSLLIVLMALCDPIEVTNHGERFQFIHLVLRFSIVSCHIFHRQKKLHHSCQLSLMRR